MRRILDIVSMKNYLLQRVVVGVCIAVIMIFVRFVLNL